MNPNPPDLHELQSLAADHRRGDARRARREREVSPERDELPVSTGAEKLEQQLLLIQHVLTLDGPYREAARGRAPIGLGRGLPALTGANGCQACGRSVGVPRPRIYDSPSR